MRIRWDEAKRQKILGERNVDFGDLDDLLSQPYVEDRRWRAPDQYRVIGFAGGRLTTFVVEYREDAIGDLVWVITSWKSTAQEEKAYEHETR